MLLYIAEGIFVVSVAGIVYLAVRAYPMARAQQQQEGTAARQGRVDWNALDRVDTKLLTIFEKLLCKARVLILKTDNAVSEKLDKVKKKSGEREGGGYHVLMELEKQNEAVKEEENKEQE